MKTFIFGLVFLGFTNLTAAQEVIASVNYDNSSFKSELTTPVKNSEYLSNFDTKNVSEVISDFQKYVANYDLANAKVYTSEDPSIYHISFSEGNNRVEATYNQEGALISCIEKYENVRLPLTISSKIARQYPDWEFNKVHCTIKYVKNSDAIIAYEVAIKKDSKRKTVKYTL